VTLFFFQFHVSEDFNQSKGIQATLVQSREGGSGRHMIPQKNHNPFNPGINLVFNTFIPMSINHRVGGREKSEFKDT